MDNTRLSQLPIRAKENRGAKNPFEGANQSAVFRPALLHAESFEHFRGALESNRLALLADGERRQKDGYDPVLPERQAVLGVAGYLEYQLSIPSFKQQLILRRPPDWQAAKNEWPGAESKVLTP